MKKMMLFPIAILFASCAAMGAGSFQGALKQLSGYETRVTGMSDALTIDKQFPKEGPIFVEFGADSSLTASISSAGKTYLLSMTDFLTAKGALGAFAFFADPGAVKAQIGNAGSASDSLVRFVKGGYLVSIRPENAGDRDGALALAKAIEKRISSTMFAPDLFSPLPKDRLIKGSELYFKGPRGFATRFPPEIGEALNIGTAIEGVAGKYDLSGGGEINLIKLRFSGRIRTVEAVNSYIESREGTPMTRPAQNREYYTLFNRDGTETYIAEYADWLLFILDGPSGGKAQEFFEIALRSM
jgi:hypothetical protein